MAEIIHRDKSDQQQQQRPVFINTAPIEDSFQQIKQNNEISDVLKELFDEGKIHLISDLTGDEIKLATRIYVIAKMKNIPNWIEGLEWYIKLMLSKKRQSRKELLDAISGYYAQRRQGFFGRLFNRGGGGGQQPTY